ncbi:MAG: hypothetical protein HRT35_31600 [Algicola sp.]|nr:hypothetical protein [Algicola sp.]
MKYALMFLLLLCSANSFACRNLSADADLLSKVKHSSEIHIATVTGLYLAEYESLLDKKLPSLEAGITHADLAATYEVKVFVHKTLRGNEKRLLTTKLDICASGTTNVRSKIVLFKVGERWFLKPYDKAMAAKLSQHFDMKD